MRVALLSGGTGGARLATGLAAVLSPDELSIVANTADDEEFWGLLVSPDVDAILYRLAGLFNDTTGFGVRNDTFHTLEMLRRLGEVKGNSRISIGYERRNSSAIWRPRTATMSDCARIGPADR